MAGFLARSALVDHAHRMALRLQGQCCADPDHAGTQNKEIGHSGQPCAITVISTLASIIRAAASVVRTG